MSAKHPRNGPTFTKGKPIKRPSVPPDPARKQAELEQKARDCGKEREFHKDPAAWALKHILKRK
jgi:hypothetical protein